MALFGKSTQPIGLDIGSEVIRVVQLKPAADPILLKYAKFKTTGCLSDGEVTDVDALASSINDLFKQADISDRQVILGISNQKIIARLLTMPYMEKDDLKNAIQFQVQDNIPIPAEEAIIDYEVIKEFQNKDNERSLQVLLIAAQKEMIQNHIAALEKAKLKPYIVDVASFALSRSLLGREAVVPDDKEIEKNNDAIGILNIGESVTNISIVHNRIPLFSRVITIGDDYFVKAIANAMGVDIQKAQKYKQDIGFPKTGEDLTAKIGKTDPEIAKKVRSILADEASKFVGEVRRSFEYGLTDTVDAEDLMELIISGVGSGSKNLLSYFKEAYPKISLGDSLSTVNLANNLKMDEQSGYAIAIGLALRGIND